MVPSRFPVLDTVRGFAFLLVVFAHMAQARGLVATGMSQLGVWIFFVLSAFLLSHPFLEAPSRLKSAEEIKAYFLRRAFRIFPPLAVCLIAYGLALPDFTWKVCVLNFLCLRIYGIFWTIFVETRYYLLLPLVVAALVALKSKPRLLWVIVSAGLALHLYDCPFWLPRHLWRAESSGPSATWVSREHFFFQYLPIFVAGTLLAALHLTMTASPAVIARFRRLAPFGFIAALLGFAFLSAAELGLLPGTTLAHFQYQGMWLPLLPLPLCLILSGATLTGGVARFFGNPAFRYVGTISYSGYLAHEIFVKRFSPLIQDHGLYAIAVLTATVTVATASHYVIERPFMEFAHRPKPATIRPRSATARA